MMNKRRLCFAISKYRPGRHVEKHTPVGRKRLVSVVGERELCIENFRAVGEVGEQLPPHSNLVGGIRSIRFASCGEYQQDKNPKYKGVSEYGTHTLMKIFFRYSI
jgi:hypothetical protein